jgi:hypothetical protein
LQQAPSFEIPSVASINSGKIAARFDPHGNPGQLSSWRNALAPGCVPASRRDRVWRSRENSAVRRRFRDAFRQIRSAEVSSAEVKWLRWLASPFEDRR